MIKIVQGDLLKSDCNVIMHQCNCFNKMGTGIARQIKTQYPKAFEADYNHPVPLGKDRLGGYSAAIDKGVLIVNLYAQIGYGRGTRTQYEYFQKALRNALQKIQKDGVESKIGLPYGIGCGLAGGNWNIILGIITEAAEEFNITIYLYKIN